MYFAKKGKLNGDNLRSLPTNVSRQPRGKSRRYHAMACLLFSCEKHQYHQRNNIRKNLRSMFYVYQSIQYRVLIPFRRRNAKIRAACDHCTLACQSRNNTFNQSQGIHSMMFGKNSLIVTTCIGTKKDFIATN